MATKKNSSTSSQPKFQLYRSETDRILGGVAGGIAEAFAIDSTLIRLIFILLFVFGGSGFLLYLILWIVTPSESEGFASKETLRKGVYEMHDRVSEIGKSFKMGSHDGRPVLGWIIILFGLAFLLSSLGFSFHLETLWPIILIVVGLLLIFS